MCQALVAFSSRLRNISLPSVKRGRILVLITWSKKKMPGRCLHPQRYRKLTVEQSVMLHLSGAVVSPDGRGNKWLWLESNIACSPQIRVYSCPSLVRAGVKTTSFDVHGSRGHSRGLVAMLQASVWESTQVRCLWLLPVGGRPMGALFSNVLPPCPPEHQVPTSCLWAPVLLEKQAKNRQGAWSLCCTSRR